MGYNVVMGKIPADLQGVLWSKSVNKIDLAQDKVYVIHQVLRYGSLDDIGWLMGVYGENEVKRVFEKCPQRIYSRPSFIFTRDVVLEASNNLVDEERYVE